MNERRTFRSRQMEESWPRYRPTAGEAALVLPTVATSEAGRHGSRLRESLPASRSAHHAIGASVKPWSRWATRMRSPFPKLHRPEFEGDNAGPHRGPHAHASDPQIAAKDQSVKGHSHRTLKPPRSRRLVPNSRRCLFPTSRFQCARPPRKMNHLPHRPSGADRWPSLNHLSRASP